MHLLKYTAISALFINCFGLYFTISASVLC